MKSPIVKRSIVVAGHKTSVSLEDQFWTGLKEIAGGRQSTMADLVAIIDAERQHGNLSSAIRLFVLGSYRDQIAAHDRKARGRLPLHNGELHASADAGRVLNLVE